MNIHRFLQLFSDMTKDNSWLTTLKLQRLEKSAKMGSQNPPLGIEQAIKKIFFARPPDKNSFKYKQYKEKHLFPFLVKIR